MTEEVTEAIAAYLKAFDEGTGTVYVEPLMRKAHLAMRSASNSPTTNGEVSEPRQTHCADPDCTGPKPHVAEAAGCKWGNPRAASDDEVERLRALVADLRASLAELLEPLERASAELVSRGRVVNENGEAAFDRARLALDRSEEALSMPIPATGDYRRGFNDGIKGATAARAALDHTTKGAE